MHIFQINIGFFKFFVFYIFRNQGLIFRKAVVCTDMVQYVVHADITIKGFYKISKFYILMF
jgi:hypothetical protein